MNPSTRAVSKLLNHLELAQFTADAEERERVQEVRELARAQIADDVQDVSRRRVRVGRSDRVLYMGDDSAAYAGLWRKWTSDQIALEAGMAGFLQRLTPRQREAIDLVVVGGLTERQAAAVMKIAQQPLNRLVHRGIDHLKRDLSAAFLEPVAA